MSRFKLDINFSKSPLINDETLPTPNAKPTKKLNEIQISSPEEEKKNVRGDKNYNFTHEFIQTTRQSCLGIFKVHHQQKTVIQKGKVILLNVTRTKIKFITKNLLCSELSHRIIIFASEKKWWKKNQDL